MSSNNGNNSSKKQKLAPIQVFLRIRPKNYQDGALAITHCTPREIYIKGHTKGYSFDQIFDENTTQVKVYKSVVSKMISDVMKGYNCTVFAYGQTGTGKTYTILGGDTVKPVDQRFNWQQDSDAGIIMRATMHLYEELDKMDPSIQRTVTVSFMEIYNEEIRDLLCDKEPITPLRIFEDKSKIVHVKNLKEFTVLSPWEIFDLLKRGCEKRQIASTLMNNRSTRSHTVFTITVSTIKTISVAGNLSNITCGKLNLIDLAGSENIAKSGSKEQRAREASNINQSLLTLGRVIKALVENSSHVPYRESKLTRILQDSLGGTTKTSIIATVSPGVSALDETMNTLEYAHNARNVTNCPTINLRTSATAAAVQEELLRLKRDLFATANEQGVYMDQENYDEMTQSLTQYKKDIMIKHETIATLTEQLENLTVQKEEWENLKQSFETTRLAYQACQSEIQDNKGQIQKDNLLLEYYEKESAKLQEFVEFMAQRDTCLRQKVDTLYASSTNNQHVIENTMILVEKTMDYITGEGCKNSEELSQNIVRLTEFNNKICQMLNNVENELIIEAERNIETNSRETNQLNEFSNHIKSKFESFVEKCNDKLEKLNQIFEIKRNHVLAIQRVLISMQDEILKQVTYREAVIKTLCDEDNKNTKCFHEKVRDILKNQKNSFVILDEEYEQLLQDESSLKEKKKCLNYWRETINKEFEEVHKYEQKLKERKERLMHLKKISESFILEKMINEHEEKRDNLITNISDFGHLKQDLANVSTNVIHNIERINREVTENIDKVYGANSQAIKTCSQQIESETLEEVNNLIRQITDERSEIARERLEMAEERTKTADQRSQMATVLHQISNILDIEGKSQLDQIKLMIGASTEVVCTTAKDMKQHIRQNLLNSLVPITHQGDTPSRLENKPSKKLSSRDSLVRKLTMDNLHDTTFSSIDEQSDSNSTS